MSAAGARLLAVKGLGLRRGGRLLFEQLSFQLGAGELLQIGGVNGAGKTSLIRILAGLSRHGFDGVVECGAAVLYIGHKAGVKGLLSPRENLRLHPAGEASPSPKQIDTALTNIGLYGYEDVPCHELSAGQQRRINLARLYFSESPLWLLDEPFTALDAEGVAALESRLLSHLGAGGGVVLSSHQALQVDWPIRQLDLSAESAN